MAQVEILIFLKSEGPIRAPEIVVHFFTMMVVTVFRGVPIALYTDRNWTILISTTPPTPLHDAHQGRLLVYMERLIATEEGRFTHA
ncbi:MAG: hypothetical protein EBS01_14435 [Verrucomicrobia bacterium]|nr:hypothetical protein [Verrucomicrobiota bacterium]